MSATVENYRWSSDREEDRFAVHEASTGETLAVIQGGGVPEIAAAVRAAHQVAERLGAAIKKLRVGASLDPETQLAGGLRRRALTLAQGA